MDGLVFVVRGLVSQIAKEVFRLWFQPSLLERRWRRGGWIVVWGGSGVVWVFGIRWLNVGFGVSPSDMEHFPLWFRIDDR